MIPQSSVQVKSFPYFTPRHSIEGGHMDPWSAWISGFKGQTYGKFGFLDGKCQKMNMNMRWNH